MNKNEKQPKPKRTADQKSLIASMIAAGCMTTMFATAVPGLIMHKNYNRDIEKLDDKQTAIYQEFKDSAEFSRYTDAQLMQLADDYSSGKIDYKEFRRCLNNMFTLDNAKQALASSTNTELKQQIKDIDKQKEARTEQYEASIIPELSAGGVIAFEAAGIVSAITGTVYSKTALAEARRKERMTRNMKKAKNRNELIK